MAARNYGKTARGVPITDELVEKLANEAEDGFDVEQILRRRRGRPPIGASAATVESVRLDPELRAALQDRAQLESATVSSLIREALWAYLALDAERRTERQRIRPTDAARAEKRTSPLFADDARRPVHITVGAMVERPVQVAPVRRRPARRLAPIVIVTGQRTTPACPGETRIRGPLHTWHRLGLGA